MNYYKKILLGSLTISIPLTMAVFPIVSCKKDKDIEIFSNFNYFLPDDKETFYIEYNTSFNNQQILFADKNHHKCHFECQISEGDEEEISKYLTWDADSKFKNVYCIIRKNIEQEFKLNFKLKFIATVGKKQKSFSAFFKFVDSTATDISTLFPINDLIAQKYLKADYLLNEFMDIYPIIFNTYANLKDDLIFYDYHIHSFKIAVSKTSFGYYGQVTINSSQIDLYRSNLIDNAGNSFYIFDNSQLCSPAFNELIQTDIEPREIVKDDIVTINYFDIFSTKIDNFFVNGFHNLTSFYSNNNTNQNNFYISDILEEISDSFFENNEKLTQMDITCNQESFTTPNLSTIGNSFFFQCEKLVQGNIDLTSFKKLKSIGTNFMYDCKSFNGTIKLPENLQSIDSSFLALCSSYAPDFLIIPASVDYIGMDFMYCTNNFSANNGIVEIESNGFPFDSIENHSYSLAVNTKECQTFIKGLNLSYLNRNDNEYRNLFQPSSGQHPYRKIKFLPKNNF